jgi:hypothetical protein
MASEVEGAVLDPTTTDGLPAEPDAICSQAVYDMSGAVLQTNVSAEQMPDPSAPATATAHSVSRFIALSFARYPSDTR